MRLFDIFRNEMVSRRELSELKTLESRLNKYNEGAWLQTADLILNALTGVHKRSLPDGIRKAVMQLCQQLLQYNLHFVVPDIPQNTPATTDEVWRRKALFTRLLADFEQPQRVKLVTATLKYLADHFTEALPPAGDMKDEAVSLSVPLYALLPNLGVAVETVFGVFFTDDLVRADLFVPLRNRLEGNLLAVSGIEPGEKSQKAVVMPTKADLPPEQMIAAYLNDTPFAAFFHTPVPFSFPFRTRFEHTHIVGGSGHGKTQLLQHLILHDLLRDGTVIVIDSQGDMIRTITHLAELAQAADRLVLIDPNDIEHPPALNLFDFGLERLNRYTPVEREKLVNGAIALYEYVFGALLGAELTQRQGVIFRFLARMMMTIPGATIHTLMQLMEDPEATRPHLHKLDPISKHFFETQFYSPTFNDTRRQILTRLWGVVSNSVLERMFAHERNSLDLFDAMNRGSLILINTAKDLLKQQGCEILGRFFIALIAQAAQERASIPEDKRKSTFIYIDEGHDYFDESMGNLLNQARKYRCGLVIAHQNLDQFETKLRATVMASTSIKMVGGLSAKDAGAFAKDMRCEPEFLLGMQKREKHTEFACFVRNYTPRPITLTVPFGEMEKRPTLTAMQYEALLEQNRKRYSTSNSTTESRHTTSDPQRMIEADFEDPDIL